MTWIVSDVVLLGEGYTDFISIDNVHGGLSSVSIDEQLMGTIVDDLEVKGKYFTFSACEPTFVEPKLPQSRGYF